MENKAVAYDEDKALERHSPQHPEDANDIVAADGVRGALRELHQKVIEARLRGLKVEMSLGSVGYSTFDPCSTAVVVITRERMI
jgi:hypothetical protein